jgi:hypothetical protein
MAQMKNTKRTGAGKGRGGEVGAPTQYHKSATSKKQNNMSPTRATDKS